MSQHHRFFRPGLVVAGLLAASAAPAQTLLLGPYSISGDLCAGDDCGLLEDLTGQTVKLKDENTRLRFADSSTTAGFATTDWELTANDSGSGGFDYFAIRNVDSNRQIFRLEGGAPANALYVDDLGQIGLGTAIPQERLHIVGDSGPGIRMEQFNATLGNQIWQITGSEQSFALQNVTASGAVPLQVSTSAPGDSLFVGASGNVGLGDATPDAALHISRGDGTAALLVENVAGSPGGTREMVKLTNTGGSYITFDNQQAGTIWYFTHEQAAPNRFLIADGVADADDAYTRFLLIGAPAPPPAATGADRTSVILDLPNVPGSLMTAMDEFASREIDLTRIESRPRRDVPGSYRFYLDAVGHIDDDAVGEALRALYRRCERVVFLGSWPCDRPTGAPPPDTADSVAWFEGVRSGEGD